MKYIIMADGKATRWQDYLGVPKHLIEIKGEAILERTVRLLRENGVEDIVITSHDERYNYAPRYEPIGNEYEIDKFNRELMDDNVCYVYGDVYFSEDAIKKIANCETDTFLFFGRHASSLNKTGKQWEEIFAIKAGKADYLREGCAFIREGLIEGSVWRGGAWELYRKMVGLPLSKNELKGNFETIDDETEDFDFPEDYDRWMEING